jgi:hypothetical protein
MAIPCASRLGPLPCPYPLTPIIAWAQPGFGRRRCTPCTGQSLAGPMAPDKVYPFKVQLASWSCPPGEGGGISPRKNFGGEISSLGIPTKFFRREICPLRNLLATKFPPGNNPFIVGPQNFWSESGWTTIPPLLLLSVTGCLDCNSPLVVIG